MDPARRNDADGARNTSSASGNPKHGEMCNWALCKEAPDAETKLRFCGKCRGARYCSTDCQRAHWPLHKEQCKHNAATREKSLSQIKTRVPGTDRKGAKQILKHSQEGMGRMGNWYHSILGLGEKVQFVAWKHRQERPIIRVTMPMRPIDGADYSLTEVVAIPRTRWEEATWGHLHVAATARDCFGLSDFRIDEAYVLYIAVESTDNSLHGGVSPQSFGLGFCRSGIHRSVLMTWTADAFAADMLLRKSLPQEGCMLARLSDGRVGVLVEHPSNPERFTVTLASGKEIISVRFEDFKLLRHNKLFNSESAHKDNSDAEDADTIAPIKERTLRLALKYSSPDWH